MKQKEKNLKVKYSNFKTKMNFNEWAQTFQVSTLAEHIPEPYEKKLDNYNEAERRRMITSVMRLVIVAPELENKRVI